MSKKVAVVLSGCGYLDGSEITEAVSVLISLSEAGAHVSCFAPDMPVQAKSHVGGAPDGTARNALVESARIARGEIQDLAKLNEGDFDAVVFPGGFGAAINLSNWAAEGSATKVHPEAARVIRKFHAACKPIGAACIAPTLVAKVLGAEGVHVTIGEDPETAREIEKTGAHHVRCDVTDYVSDRDNKVITTPAYMYNARPHEVFSGIRKMIQELVEMA